MTEGKLVFLPKGYRVVPEKLDYDGDMREAAHQVIVQNKPYTNALIDKMWDELLNNAKPIDTPPVLRWEGGDLKFYGAVLVTVYRAYGSQWAYYANPLAHFCGIETEQEARRAAEKALGFPDRLIVDESN